MPMKRACPRCGVIRFVKASASRAQTCWACFCAEGLNGKGKRAPLPDQQFAMSHAADRRALVPQSSWWAVAESEFAENYQKELPRLLAIGPDAPRRVEAPAE